MSPLKDMSSQKVKLASMWIHWKFLLLSAVHILSFELGACGTLWAVRNY